MKHRTAAWLAWSLCTLTIVLVAFVVGFAVFYQDNLRNLAYLLGVVSNAIVGAVLASHRPRNPVGWFFVFSAASFAVSEATFRYAVYGLVIDPGSLPLARAMAWPPTWLWVPGVALVLVFVPLYFPNGRLLSPRWRPILWLTIFLSVVSAVLSAFSPAKVNDAWDITNPLGLAALRPANGALEVVMAVLLLSSLVSLVVRFRRSQGREYQQMKWITYAAGTMFTMVVLVTVLDLIAANSALAKVANPLTGAMFAGIPVAVGIAVLRYRLYEIDRIINRTLVYGALTVMLALIYFGGVATIQVLLRVLTGQEEQPQLALVVSTLVIAALFNPLRRRIQSFIDRSFYRRKYDARKTLEAFSAKLREETDLHALTNDLVGVVKETMQPAHVSVWLHPDPALKDENKRAAIRESGHGE
jgi:divalent metal cation (Fe/Co/Zn/Cd) transporter